MSAASPLTLPRLTHLQRLEAESIHIMREVVAECEKPGDALFDRQGQRGDAAPGDEGVLSVASRRSRCCTSTRPGSSARCIAFRDADGARARARAARAHEPRGARAGHQPVHARLGRPHRHDEDAGAEAGARQVRLRRGLRRRPPRRGEVARQGAHLLVPLARSTAGTRRTSGPSSGASTTRASTRARAIRVFPLSNWTELDIWQYIYLENIPIVPLYFAARAAGGRARRHADHGRRRAHAAARPARCR